MSLSSPSKHPFPWLVEERLEDGRLLVRCSELEGGCGETLEIAPRAKGYVCVHPEYVAFYRAHNSCCAEAMATLAHRREEVRLRQAQEDAYYKARLAASLRRQAIHVASYSRRDAHLNWKEAWRTGLSDAEIMAALRHNMVAGTQDGLEFRGEAHRLACAWTTDPEPAITFPETGEVLVGNSLLEAVRDALSIGERTAA